MNMAAFGKHTLGVALFAGAATLAIAVVGAIASYIDNYYTTSVGQWVANDLRLRVYEHLHRLSLRYYDHAKIGALVSTITSDVATIQDFASSSTLDIVIDLITILFMVGLMFWLDWDFTLIAVAFTPVLLVFVLSFQESVKEATRAVRVRQSDVLSIVQRGLGSIRVTKAFGRQDLEMAHLEAASHATVAAALRARQDQVADVALGQRRGRDLHRHRALERDIADRCGNHDGGRADRLPRLSQAVLQAGEGSRQHDQHHCADHRCAGAHRDHPFGRRGDQGTCRCRRSGAGQGRDHLRSREFWIQQG
jgi:ABC-type multidrug transport system fused ATPase/permease subunit